MCTITIKQRIRPGVGIVIALGVVAGLWTGGVAAQQLVAVTPSPDPALKQLPIHTMLYEAERLVAGIAVPTAALRAQLAQRGVRVRADGKAYVEIAGPRGAAPVPASTIIPFGGEVVRTWRQRTLAWVPISAATDLARALPPGYFLEPAVTPQPDEVLGEGPEAVGTDHYRSAGATGAGITIAVIDSGFDNLTEARANGDAPSTAMSVEINYTPSGFQNPANGTHGTGCVEAAYDHCSGASWRLYKIDSLTDLGTAVTNAIANGVDVISHSLSYYNRGWPDDSGAACDAANEAAENGILFFTSAGNRAESHHQAQFNDSNSSSWHNFATNDELIDITMPGDASSRFYLSWDTTGGTYDYDLYLYDADVTTVLASSTHGSNTYEDFTWTNPSASSQVVKLAVYRFSGGTTEFEIFVHKRGTWGEYIVEAGSTTSPSNATNPLVISVGAVDVDDFDLPSGTTGIVMGYSGRGPSNSEMILPDLSGPTNTSGFTYATFSGTSCSTPNTAGAATVFWSSETPMTGDNVQELLFEMADLFRDWGTPGRDNNYGEGGVTAPRNHSSIVLLNRALGNTAGSLDLPYYYFDDAYQYASSGAQMLFFGGTYPESIAYTMTKLLSMDNYGAAATVGGP